MNTKPFHYLSAASMQRWLITLSLALLCNASAGAQTKTDREHDGLKGPVKSVRVELVEFAADGQTVLRQRHVQSMTSYDEQGNLFEELAYRPDGSFWSKKTYARDGEGRKIVTSYNRDGALSSQMIYTYDTAGRIAGWANYDAKGALKNRAVNTYDKDGHLTGGEVYNADGSLESRTVIMFDEEKKQPVNSFYDAHGALINKESLTSAGGDVIRYQPDGAVWMKETHGAAKFEYDAQGNWIKQTWPRSVTQDNKTVETIEVLYREIAYY